MSIILLISTFLSLFLACLVFLKKRKTYPDILLGLWLIFTTVHLLLLYVQIYNAEHEFPFPYLIGVDISLIVAHAIWIFIYIFSYVHPNSKPLRELWHILPLGLINLVLFETFYTRSNDEKIAILKSAFQGTGYTDKSFELSIYMVISFAFAYLIACIWLLRKHKINVKKYYSNLDGIDLRWLKRVLYCIFLVIFINTILDWTRNYLDIIPSDLSISIGHIFIFFAVSYIGIYGIRQTKLFTDYEPISSKKDILNLNAQNTIINKSENTDSFSNDYEMLFLFIEENKPYLDPSLNLFTLAELVGFNTRYLSQLINKGTGKNFFDFVNLFRTNEFKKRVRDPENKKFTLLSIAYDCGFNSKATFNRVFKNQTGYTPSEFFNNPDLD